jgi:RNA polymerase sigma-70 factor (ECF subfamily)
MARRPPDDRSSESIGDLYDRIAGALYRYALMVLVDPEAASDVVQQVFAALLRQKHHEIANAEHYLRRAVRNECFTLLRRRQRDPAATNESVLLEPIAPFDDVDVRLAIEQGLRVLSPEQREVVHLKVYEGMTFQEIASLIGEPLNTVASRYRYALSKLRTELGASR